MPRSVGRRLLGLFIGLALPAIMPASAFAMLDKAAIYEYRADHNCVRIETGVLGAGSVSTPFSLDQLGVGQGKERLRFTAEDPAALYDLHIGDLFTINVTTDDYPYDPIKVVAQGVNFSPYRLWKVFIAADQAKLAAKNYLFEGFFIIEDRPGQPQLPDELYCEELMNYINY